MSIYINESLLIDHINAAKEIITIRNNIINICGIDLTENDILNNTAIINSINTTYKDLITADYLNKMLFLIVDVPTTLTENLTNTQSINLINM